MFNTIQQNNQSMQSTTYNQMANNANAQLPVPANYVIDTNWVDPLYIPDQVPIAYTPSSANFFTQKTLQNVTGNFIGNLQVRARRGGALSIFLYNLMSSEGFANNYYAQAIESIFEMLNTNDDDVEDGISEIKITPIIDDVISMYYAIYLNDFPALNGLIDPSTRDKVFRRAKIVSDIRMGNMTRAGNNPSTLVHGFQQNQNMHQQHNQFQNQQFTQNQPPMNTGHNQHFNQQFTHDNGFHNHGNVSHGQLAANNATSTSTAWFTQGSSNNMQHQPQSNAVMNNQPTVSADPNVAFMTGQVTTPVEVSHTGTYENLAVIHDVASHDEEREVIAVVNPPNSDYQLVSESQRDVIDHFFDGIVPEEARVISYPLRGKEEKVFLFPFKLVNDIYDEQSAFKDQLSKQRFDLQYAHVPAFNTLAEKLGVVLESDGTRHYVISNVDSDMDINDHIPPLAVVQWDKVQTKPLVDSDGKKIDNSGAYVFDTPVTATTSVASATAHYAMRAMVENCSYGQETERVVEYRVNNANSFYVTNPKAVLDVLKVGRKIDTIHEFIADVEMAVKGNKRLHHYVNTTVVKAINDYVLYSTGTDIVISSIFDGSVSELLDLLAEDYGVGMVKLVEKALPSVIGDAICTAVSSDDVEDFTLPITVTNDDGEENLDKDKKIRSNLVLMVERVQNTEMPYTFDELGLGLTSPHELAKPHGMVDQNMMPEVYNALKSIVMRHGSAKIIPSKIITMDGIELSIHRSAYDFETLIVVKEN